MEFLKKNQRFSLNYGGKSFSASDATVSMEETGNEFITTYKLKDGLVIINVAKKHEKFDAYEWVNYFKNTGDTPTEIISDLWDCNCEIPIGYSKQYSWTAYLDDPENETQIYAPTGSLCNNYEFYSNMNSITRSKYENLIFSGQSKSYSTSGGVSSNTRAPFFNIHCRNRGVMVAVGWTGQWNSNIERTEEGVIFKSKIEDTHFRLLPGEEIRTSSVMIMPYECGLDDSFNKWRRFIKECVTPVKSFEEMPYCVGLWGGMKSKSMIDRIETAKRNKLPFTHTWIDAGWYGTGTKDSPDEFEGDWGLQAGNWRVNSHIHPNGLRDVSHAIKDASMKFLLWFEIERSVPTTPVAVEHPEYFFKNEKDGIYILNLGNEEAWQYAYNTLEEKIEELNISCYRQDFNVLPLSLWRETDNEDRKGISEIKHINGLYKLWDNLLARFPRLLIDNCSSGGRRIDIETLKRSVPLWRSDAQCPANFPPEFTQNHTLTFSKYMTYSGVGLGRDERDVYRWRSSYTPALTTQMTFSERNPYDEEHTDMDMIKKYSEEYLKVRPYLSCDFYPLTEPSDSKDVWCAWQYNRPEENDGILQVFRRAKAPYIKGSYKLNGVKSNKNYVFIDADTNEEKIISGEQLVSAGFEVEIPESRTAKLYFYKEV